ncbi:hypothetical protein LSUE1_G007028, partial [Lachnellula suecica]
RRKRLDLLQFDIVESVEPDLLPTCYLTPLYVRGDLSLVLGR